MESFGDRTDDLFEDTQEQQENLGRSAGFDSTKVERQFKTFNAI